MPNNLHSKKVLLWNQVYSAKILYELQYRLLIIIIIIMTG